MVLGALGCGVFANSPEAVDLAEATTKKKHCDKIVETKKAVRNSVLRISVNCWEGHCGGMAKALRTR